MSLNLFCTGFLPIFWVFATPRFLVPIWADAVGNGLFWTGATLAWFNMLLAFAQGKTHRDAYFAVFTAVSGLGGFAASLVGGTVAQILNGFHLNLGPFHFVNFHIMFALAGLGRFATLTLLRTVPDERAKPVAYVLEGIGQFTARRLSAGRDLVIEGITVLSRRIFAPK